MKRMTMTARDLRQTSTRSEEILWNALRDRRLDGTKWRRQQKVDRFVVDFFCPEAQLVVEIDGGVHESRQEADAERELAIARFGLRVVRFSATAVENDLPHVLAALRIAIAPSPLAGEGDALRTE